jgi:hypothetical protein
MAKTSEQTSLPSILRSRESDKHVGIPTIRFNNEEK